MGCQLSLYINLGMGADLKTLNGTANEKATQLCGFLYYNLQVTFLYRAHLRAVWFANERFLLPFSRVQSHPRNWHRTPYRF